MSTVGAQVETKGAASGTAAVTWVQIAILAVLLLFVYRVTLLDGIVDRWISDGNWSHGWLIPLFSLYLLRTRRDALARCVVRPCYTGAVLLAASLAAYFVFAWVFRSGYPRALSLVGCIFGITLLFGGWQVLRVAWLPIAFLLLAIPLPDRLYVELSLPLQRVATVVASTIMPFFASGLYTESQGVVIDYIIPGPESVPRQLNVAEACSGMRLLMAFVTLGIAMAYVHPRPTWQRIIMVAGCVPIAVFCNAIRVTTTGLLHVYGYEQLAKGTPHQLLGIAMLVIALGLYALLGYVLSHLFVEEST